MTKKQVGIIFTLLALIVCTALIATKLNNEGFNDPTDLSGALVEGDKDKDDEKEAETLNQNDFFIDSRSVREHNDAKTVQDLKDVINNQNTTQAQKETASKELTKITVRQGQQNSAELNLKNKGYTDALCNISEDGVKADVIIKANNPLGDKEGANIQEIVQNATGIKEVVISVKK